MADLEAAAAPSKSVDTVIQYPTVDLMHRQSSHAKITTKTMRNSANLPWGHPSTRAYVRPPDDRITEPTMNHVITDSHTIAACITHPPQHTTKSIHQKIGAINVTGTAKIPQLLSGATPSDNDPTDGTINTSPDIPDHP